MLRTPLRKKTLNPFAKSTSVQSFAKCSERCRVSYAIVQEGVSPGVMTLRTYSARPWALSPIVRSLMAFEPTGYILPRRPPVPNGITVQYASSRSFHAPASIREPSSEANSAYRGSVSQVRMVAAEWSVTVPA